MPGRLKIHPAAAFKSLRDMTVREKQFLLNEMGQVRGLVPLVMKQRNRQQWSPEDKVLLAMHLRRLSRISPYLAVLAMPGGFLMMPAFAWWLDRRRNRNRIDTGASASN
ncbi:MAG: hypothetical protein AABZ67_15310 [Pseudomonadota bacterium]